MNISEQQLNNMMSAVTTALQPLIRALPVTPVEWADQNYYLPKESSYGEGEWKTLPFQIAIMNSMGNDQIRTVNLIKSARVGYTKMLLGVVGYFIEHKSRNSLLFQPTDSAAEDFMKSHVEATIRNVPCLKDLSPWLGRKHRDNTLTLKRFSSGVGFWCLGGAAAKNYREKSVDVVCYDELSSFEPDVEKEGSPTLLGETWEEAVGEKLDHQVLMDKVVRYTAAVPARVVYLTAGIDSQRNRFEMYVWGWAPGEEAFLVDKIIIMGRPDEEETLLRVDAAINKKYRHADGTEMTISRVCWDTGGIDGEIVYQRSKKHGVFRVLPVKGASVYGKPVITMPKTRNQRGVYLCEVGTDTAKEILYARMKADPTPVDEATSYAIRFPDDPEIFSQTEAQQLVAEELVEKWEKGKMRLLWDNKKRRNEALDCLVYAYAALRVSVQRWQLDLAVLAKSREEETTRPTLKELAAKLSGGVNGYSR